MSSRFAADPDDTPIVGTHKGDVLTGTSGNDVIEGLRGRDVLYGKGGDDQLHGGPGHDTLVGGSGTNLLDGGHGNDAASYLGARHGVTVSLAISGPQATGVSTDTLVSIEELAGSNHHDVLIGDAASNELIGNLGNDILEGGGGADFLEGDGGADIFYFTAASARDTVADFAHAQHDRIWIDAAGVTRMSDLAIGSDGHGGAVVGYGTTMIDLAGVDPASLAAGDFRFGALPGSSGALAAHDPMAASADHDHGLLHVAAIA